jgi:hypothetical protein
MHRVLVWPALAIVLLASGCGSGPPTQLVQQTSLPAASTQPAHPLNSDESAWLQTWARNESDFAKRMRFCENFAYTYLAFSRGEITYPSYSVKGNKVDNESTDFTGDQILALAWLGTAENPTIPVPRRMRRLNQLWIDELIHYARGFDYMAPYRVLAAGQSTAWCVQKLKAEFRHGNAFAAKARAEGHRLARRGTSGGYSVPPF